MPPSWTLPRFPDLYVQLPTSCLHSVISETPQTLNMAKTKLLIPPYPPVNITATVFFPVLDNGASTTIATKTDHPGAIPESCFTLSLHIRKSSCAFLKHASRIQPLFLNHHPGLFNFGSHLDFGSSLQPDHPCFSFNPTVCSPLYSLMESGETLLKSLLWFKYLPITSRIDPPISQSFQSSLLSPCPLFPPKRKETYGFLSTPNSVILLSICTLWYQFLEEPSILVYIGCQKWEYLYIKLDMDLTPLAWNFSWVSRPKTEGMTRARDTTTQRIFRWGSEQVRGWLMWVPKCFCSYGNLYEEASITGMSPCGVQRAHASMYLSLATDCLTPVPQCSVSFLISCVS